jgi:hypothetical protein
MKDARAEAPAAGAGPTALRWPGAAFAAMALGIAMLAAPASIEGPILLPIAPGHALSVLDTIAVVPLVIGSFVLYAGLWHRRARLAGVVRGGPGAAAIWVFTGGLGLGLLLASAFSAFFWWWAIGAVLFGLALVAAVLAAAA